MKTPPKPGASISPSDSMGSRWIRTTVIGVASDTLNFGLRSFEYMSFNDRFSTPLRPDPATRVDRCCRPGPPHFASEGHRCFRTPFQSSERVPLRTRRGALFFQSRVFGEQLWCCSLQLHTGPRPGVSLVGVVVTPFTTRPQWDRKGPRSPGRCDVAASRAASLVNLGRNPAARVLGRTALDNFRRRYPRHGGGSTSGPNRRGECPRRSRCSAACRLRSGFATWVRAQSARSAYPPERDHILAHSVPGDGTLWASPKPQGLLALSLLWH